MSKTYQKRQQYRREREKESIRYMIRRAEREYIKYLAMEMNQNGTIR